MSMVTTTSLSLLLHSLIIQLLVSHLSFVLKLVFLCWLWKSLFQLLDSELAMTLLSMYNMAVFFIAQNWHNRLHFFHSILVFVSTISIVFFFESSIIRTDSLSTVCSYFMFLILIHFLTIALHNLSFFQIFSISL